MKKIKIKDTYIHYTEKNNDSETTLLFVHGYSSSSDAFKYLYEKENNYNLISINFPGNKYSDNPDLSIEEITYLLNKFIKKIKTDIILVGHSYGGAVIASLKSYRKIKGYVFLSSLTPSLLHSKIHLKLISIVNREIPKTLLKKITIPLVKEIHYNEKFALNIIDPPKGFKKIRKENLMNEHYINKVLSKNIESIKKPIYSFIGAGDVIIPKKQYVEYFKNKFNVDTIIIPKARHNPIKYQPEMINNYFNNLFPYKERKHNKKIII